MANYFDECNEYVGIDTLLANITDTDSNGDPAIRVKDTDASAVLNSIAKTENTPHISGDKGVQMLAVRTDDGTVLAADGDYIPLSIDSLGNLRVSGSASSVTAEYNSPEDFTATYLGTGTITIGSLPISITDDSQWAYVIAVDETLHRAYAFVAASSGIKFDYTGTTLTIYQNGVAITSLVGTSTWRFRVGLNGIKKAYDPDSNTIDVTQGNTLPFHRETVSETISLSTSDTTFYYAMSMDTFKHASIGLLSTIAGSSYVYKIYASNNASITIPATGYTIVAGDGWSDVSADILGAASITINANGSRKDFIDTAISVEWLLLQFTYDYTAGTNSIIINAKKFY